MQLDLTLLRLLKHRDSYTRLHSAVPAQGVDAKTRTILADFGAYFKANPGVQEIEPASFRTYFALRHPKLKPDALEVYSAIIGQIGRPAPEGTENGIREQLVSVATAAQLAELLDNYDNGEADLSAGLASIHEQHAKMLGVQVRHPRVKDRIEDILGAEKSGWGFKWRLRCLNESMTPFKPGDFGIIAARVDAGKTTTLTSELSFMARQVDDLFPDRQRSIIVLNNEGPGRRLKQRFYNSALEMTTTQLVELTDQGIIYDEYVKAQGGRDKFYVFDVHDYSMGQLEGIVRDTDPAIIVFDMLDNVRMDTRAVNGGQRTDEILEALYQRARAWGVKYEAAVLATSQLNGDADGVPFPSLSMLANSRTGKAGAADFVLTVGMSHAEGLGSARFIGLPKNKKHREGGRKDPRREVIFDGQRALLIDPEDS